jgi:phosphohistidine phosphatase
VRLYLLRHAKSSWANPGLEDHERPLAPRGERAASLMGVYLAQGRVQPSLLLCSSARRTLETLERVVAQLSPRPGVCIERELYLADPAALLARVQQVEERHAALMLIGHNPGMAELARLLAGRGDEVARRRMRAKFPTAALAELRFQLSDWREVAAGGGELRAFCTPKDLV